MGDAGSVDGADVLELRRVVAQVVEEALTVSEQHLYHVELELVQQPGRRVSPATPLQQSRGNVLSIHVNRKVATVPPEG